MVDFGRTLEGGGGPQSRGKVEFGIAYGLA